MHPVPSSAAARVPIDNCSTSKHTNTPLQLPSLPLSSVMLPFQDKNNSNNLPKPLSAPMKLLQIHQPALLFNVAIQLGTPSRYRNHPVPAPDTLLADQHKTHQVSTTSAPNKRRPLLSAAQKRKIRKRLRPTSTLLLSYAARASIDQTQTRRNTLHTEDCHAITITSWIQEDPKCACRSLSQLSVHPNAQFAVAETPHRWEVLFVAGNGEIKMQSAVPFHRVLGRILPRSLLLQGGGAMSFCSSVCSSLFNSYIQAGPMSSKDIIGPLKVLAFHAASGTSRKLRYITLTGSRRDCVGC